MRKQEDFWRYKKKHTHTHPLTWVNGEDCEVEDASLHQLSAVGVGEDVTIGVDTEQARVVHAVHDHGGARRLHLPSTGQNKRQAISDTSQM